MSAPDAALLERCGRIARKGESADDVLAQAAHMGELTGNGTAWALDRMEANRRAFDFAREDGEGIALAGELTAAVDARHDAERERERRERAEKLAADPRLLDGAAILRAPRTVPAVWGRGARVAWPEHEPLVLFGPPGVVTSTLAQHLALARAGIGPGELLGMAVAPDPTGRVLYVAADRPAQVLRSWRRMVSDDDAEALAERIVLWRGPPDFDLRREPEKLAELLGVGTVVLDSLKDVASRTSEDEGGEGIARALQRLVADEVDVLAIHHNRKATSENKHPEKLDDVYGSRWIGAGAGSVLGLFAEPGATVVELRQLKMPAEQVGPLRVELDKSTGALRVLGAVTVRALLAAAARAGQAGLSARDAAAPSWDQVAGPVAPKSAAGRRNVPIPGALRAPLAAHMLACPWTDGLVFGRTAERPLNPSALRKRAATAWRRGGLEGLGLHDCRHSYASLMIAAGVNVKALQTFMGHSSITVTMDRYGHLMPGSEDVAAGLLDDYLGAAAQA